jgi:hypothetical protein
MAISMRATRSSRRCARSTRSAEMKAVLDAVGVRDKAFVRELKSRRRDAADTMQRVDAGVMAQKAYAAPQAGSGPRFTDKAG